MRICFFGLSGPFSQHVLEAIPADLQVDAVIVAARPPRRSTRAALRRAAARLGWRFDAMSRIARRRGATYRRASSASDPGVAELVTRLRPDVIVIGMYRWILPPAVFGAARLGAINVHPSLLPRHRGPMPWYWIYRGDDRVSGVTTHWVTEEADAGPVLRQVEVTIPRGLPVDDLYRLKTSLVGSLVRDTLEVVAGGGATGTPQNEASATAAPFVDWSQPRVDWSWPTERVWHFLAGLFPRFREPLRDGEDRVIEYRGVLGFVCAEHAEPAGTVRRVGGELRLFCGDGFVRLAPGRWKGAR